MIDLIQRYRDNNKKIRLAAIIESAVCRWGEEEGEEEEENGEEENWLYEYYLLGSNENCKLIGCQREMEPVRGSPKLFFSRAKSTAIHFIAGH